MTYQAWYGQAWQASLFQAWHTSGLDRPGTKAGVLMDRPVNVRPGKASWKRCQLHPSNRLVAGLPDIPVHQPCHPCLSNGNLEQLVRNEKSGLPTKEMLHFPTHQQDTKIVYLHFPIILFLPFSLGAQVVGSPVLKCLPSMCSVTLVSFE